MPKSGDGVTALPSEAAVRLESVLRAACDPKRTAVFVTLVIRLKLRSISRRVAVLCEQHARLGSRLFGQLFGGTVDDSLVDPAALLRIARQAFLNHRQVGNPFHCF